MLQLSDEELEAINKAIYERYKMDFSKYEKHSLKRRMVKAMEKFHFQSVLELWRHILYGQDFIFEFIDELTVNLTDMFRDAGFWIGLREKILPLFRSQETLDIWHAGCSTGQEMYSMMVVLRETGLLAKTHITATDINTRVIETTQKGIYPLEDLDNYKRSYIAAGGKGMLENYVTEKHAEKQMVFDVLQPASVDIYQHNLAKDKVNKKFDLIFCRNVMIYFDNALKMHVLEVLHESLKPNGYLLMGYFDALPMEYEQYFELYEPRLKIFKRK